MSKAHGQSSFYESRSIYWPERTTKSLEPDQERQPPPPPNAEIDVRNDEARDDDSRNRILRLELMFEDSQTQTLMLGTQIEYLENHITELEAQYIESQNRLRIQGDNSETRITALEANVTRQRALLARRVVRRRILSNRERVRLRRANRRLRRRLLVMDAVQDVHGLADGWRI
ncbi:uncharacterized protein EAF01_009435 [Botrytis porri]|uniref:Uncharacterized protein n=1 Tax=Botrytis porri TaxID=87229 RepID=A0A4Z1K136_9HELO|nr:uncharacterized protein EAF01_009435 [Botrytis porri]KAF7895473.1 hypothetical protein EAF01_009435 [Botrytis porri]TGO79286.1 hypothetical protein BPOR_1965g00010 [Botrytis porri]